MEWHWDYSWFHGKALWVAHVLPTQWAFHGMALGFLIGVVHGKGLWVAHGIPNGVLCVAHWGFHPMGIPWNGFGIILGWNHGKALWVAHVLPTQWAFHGMALGFLIGVPMERFCG